MEEEGEGDLDSLASGELSLLEDERWGLGVDSRGLEESFNDLEEEAPPENTFGWRWVVGEGETPTAAYMAACKAA